MILSNLKLYVLLMYVHVVHTVDFNQVVFDLSNMSFELSVYMSPEAR